MKSFTTHFMKTSSWRILTRTLATLGATGLLDGTVQAQGIPEPPAVIYGTIRNVGAFNSRVKAGSLVWRVTRISSGVPGATFTLNTTLADVLGQFSYVVEIPCETTLPAVTSTNTSAMILASFSSDTYRFDASVDGSPATFVVPAQNTISAVPQSRGQFNRIDLTINIPCADVNHNGICDWWEYFYFGDFVDANADPDGDGMTNLQEFLAGTDPTNRNSALVFVDYHPYPAGGFLVAWNSAEGRSYTLLSTSHLLATNNFTTVRSNILATPPRNTIIDTNASASNPRFYILKLEL